ncbi:MAG: SDR family oxidoreductase [Chloroflexota bacterium]
MILVSGAAGKTGLAVIAALAARGEVVRAFVKNRRQTEAIHDAGAFGVVYGDMGDLSAWEKAMDGIRALYHIGPNMHEEEEQFGLNALQAARKTQLEQFVYHSVLHPQTEAMPHHWHKLRVEEKILESGLSFTILQPAAYMQNISGGWQHIVEKGDYRVPYPVTTRLSLVHLADVAQVAARVLTEAGHAGATYELVGTDPLAQTEVADQIAAALGYEVRAEEISLELWREQAEADGMASYAKESLLKMFRYYAKFGFAGNPRVLTWLLGREPRTLADLVRDKIR